MKGVVEMGEQGPQDQGVQCWLREPEKSRIVNKQFEQQGGAVIYPTLGFQRGTFFSLLAWVEIRVRRIGHGCLLEI